MGKFLRKIARSRAAGYCAAVLGLSLLVLLMLPFHEFFRGTPGLIFILLILFVAVGWGRGPALFAALAALLALSYFFIPPFRTMRVVEPRWWFTLIAFAVTAITVGQLSARLRQRAEEAERAKHEVEQLYTKLQSALERASQVEALRRSEQFKSTLLDAVTHDLRTPLTSIKLAAVTLLRNKNLITCLADPDRELLDVIDQETTRLDHFIENMLVMARIEAGQLNLRLFASPVDEIISQAVKQQKCCRIKLQIPDDLPPVEADSRAVAQVVYTLLENAGKYGLPDTDIVVSAVRGTDETIHFSVQNQGPVIPSALRERVFEKFYRAIDEPSSPAATRGSHKRGTGMGLAIARGIVEAHHGRIWIEDAASGQGTKVTFTIPISRWYLRTPDYSI